MFRLLPDLNGDEIILCTIEQMNVFKKCSEWLRIKKINVRY